MCGSAAPRCCRRPTGTVRSIGEEWQACPTGAPAPGGNTAHSDGKCRHAADSGACLRRWCNNRVLWCGKWRPQLQGKERRCHQYTPCCRCGGSSGHTLCKCRHQHGHSVCIQLQGQGTALTTVQAAEAAVATVGALVLSSTKLYQKFLPHSLQA